MKKTKKLIPILFSIFLSISLSGCGTANIGTNTTLDKNGAGTFSFKLITTGIFSQTDPSSDAQNKGATKDTDKNKFFNSSINKLPSKKYKEGDKNIEESSLSFKNVKELNDLFKDAKETDFKLNIKENKQLFKTTYVYTLKLPKDFTLKKLTEEINKNPNSAQDIGVSNEQIVSFVGQAIGFSASVTLPGKIVSQNATSTTGNVLKWDYALSQINPDNTMTATCEVMNTTNIYLASGIGVLLLATILIILIKKKKATSKSI